MTHLTFAAERTRYPFPISLTPRAITVKQQAPPTPFEPASANTATDLPPLRDGEYGGFFACIERFAQNDLRREFDRATHLHRTPLSFDLFVAAFEFGADAVQRCGAYGLSFSEAEPTLTRQWTDAVPGVPWHAARPVIKHAWDEVADTWE